MSGKRTALKVLGILQVIFGFCLLASCFLSSSSLFDVQSMLISAINAQGIDVTGVNVVAVFISFLAIAAIWSLIIGFLMIRAAKYPEKSTVIYVLVIIDLVISVIGIISSAVFGSFSGTTLGHIIFVGIVFWLIMSIRKETREIEI